MYSHPNCSYYLLVCSDRIMLLWICVALMLNSFIYCIHSLEANKNVNASSSTEIHKNESEVESNVSDQFDEKIKHENWKNMNDAARKAKKRFTKRSSNSILNTTGGVYCPKIPVLKNGYESKGRGVIPTIITRNTCAFDCLFQIFAACYVDVPSIKTIIDGSDSKFACLIKNAINIGNINKTYTERNMLLFEIYNDSEHLRYVTENIVEINCISSFDEVLCK